MAIHVQISNTRFLRFFVSRRWPRLLFQDWDQYLDFCPRRLKTKTTTLLHKSLRWCSVNCDIKLLFHFCCFKMKKLAALIYKPDIDSTVIYYPSGASSSSSVSDTSWLLGDTARRHLVIKDLLSGSNLLSANSLDVADSCLVCGTDAEQICVITNLAIGWPCSRKTWQR